MKKILLIILSVLCASAFSTAAFAETSVKYDMNTSSFIISGKLGDTAALKEVSVMILYPDSNAAEIANGNAGSIGFCFRQQSPKLQSVIGTQIEKAFTGISADLNPHIPRKKIRKFHKVPPA